MAEVYAKARGGPDCACPDTEAHTCPYQSDINDDDETLCRCCPSCTQECADDI